MNKKIFVILAALLSSLIGPIVKLLITDMHPLSITFFRIFIGFLTLAIILPFLDKNTFKLKLKDIPTYILIGILFAITLGTFVTALNHAPVSNVVLIASFAVISTAIFAYIFLKETLKLNQKIAIVIAIIGLAIINPFNFNSIHYIGNLLALGSALAYSLLIVFMRTEEKTHSPGFLIWIFFFSTLALTPFIARYGVGQNFMSNLLLILTLGVFSTAIPFLLVAYAIKKLHADTVSIINLLVIPLASILLAAIIIDEIPTLRVTIGGLILILAGTILHYFRKKYLKRIREQLHIPL